VIVALVVALLIKSYVYLIDPPTKIDLTVPVQPKNLPSGLGVSSIIPARVDMSIYGVKSKVEKYTEREFSAIADCSGISSEGHYEVPVRISQSRLPGVKHVLIPNTAHLIIGVYQKKFFDPVARQIGELKSSRIISKIEGMPQTIQVSGSAKVLERVSRVMYPLNLDKPGDIWTDEISFIAVDEAGAPIDNLQLDPPKASITVYLREHKVKQQLPVIVKVRGTPAKNYAITSQSVEPTQVEVIGEPSIIGSLAFVETQTISVAGATSDISTTVDLVAPDPAITFQPSKVQVKISISQVLSRRDIEDIPIELKRRRENYTYRIEPSTINVRVQGAVEKLSTLDLSLIRPTIDVSIYDVGTYTVALEQPGLPSDVSLVNMIPSEVQLTVSKSENGSEG
jgi:YbbR domain-containing protein